MLEIFYRDDLTIILHGDCIELLGQCPDKTFAAVLTDPPYNVGKEYSQHNDKMEIQDYIDWCCKWFTELKRVTDGVILITPSRGKLNYWIKYIEEPYDILVWYKSNSCTNGHGTKLMLWEPILMYNKPKKRPDGDFYNVNISIQRGVGDHPCPKSLKLFKQIILNFTEPGDKILDPFGGTMTTAVAAKYLGRKCMCIEIDKHYCEIGKLRLQQELLNLDLEE